MCSFVGKYRKTVLGETSASSAIRSTDVPPYPCSPKSR